MAHTITANDCISMRKAIDMLFDNWVITEDIEGASKSIRECVVYDKNNLLLLVHEKELQLKKERRANHLKK